MDGYRLKATEQVSRGSQACCTGTTKNNQITLIGLNQFQLKSTRRVLTEGQRRGDEKSVKDTDHRIPIVAISAQNKQNGGQELVADGQKDL